MSLEVCPVVPGDSCGMLPFGDAGFFEAVPLDISDS